MPLFARRRLQHMFEGLEAPLGEQGATDLIQRLEGIDTNSALAAELELGLLWALSQVTDTKLHPKLPNGRRPEAYCPTLFISAPAFIEVSAVSDDTFSDRDKMDRTANIICQAAKQFQPLSLNHLFFHFTEKTGYEDGAYYRRRNVSADFLLTSELKENLRDWLLSENPKATPLRLRNEKVDVVISWRDFVHPEGRTFSSMPPIAYSLENNPIFRRLEKKRAQLSSAPAGVIRCIFLADAGSDILRNLKPINQDSRAICGESIIWHFLDRYNIDIVAIFSPSRRNQYDLRSPKIWRLTYFDKRNQTSENVASATTAGEYINLERLAATLPPPHYEGYQARSLHRQGAFRPQARGQYLAWEMCTRDSMTSVSVKVSSRLVLEYLSGRLSIDQFRRFGAPEHLDSLLSRGFTIQNIRLEKKGIDEDDDHLVIDLDLDPAASPLKKSRKSRI